MAETTAFVTVAMCTHNHADRLRLTLDGLRELAPPPVPWELLLIDNASTDETPRLLEGGGWRPRAVPVRMVKESRLGISNARNRAIREARGEYLVFIDDDETPDPAWLAAHAAAMMEWRPDALGGPIDVLFVGSERPDWLTDEVLGFLGRLDHGTEPRWLTQPDTPIHGGNFAFRRALFDEIGLFDTRLGRMGEANVGGEDTEIYDRMLARRCRVRWVPMAKIFHRIEPLKLRRGYFLDVHYRHGRIEGSRARNGRSRVPPPYLAPQLYRAIKATAAAWTRQGRAASLRKEMNVAYFLGYIHGWARD